MAGIDKSFLPNSDQEIANSFVEAVNNWLLIADGVSQRDSSANSSKDQ